MLRPSFSPPAFSPRRVLGLVLALLLGAGIGLGTAAVWAGPEAAATPVPRAQAAQLDEPAPTTADKPTLPAEAESTPPKPPKPPKPPAPPAAPRLTLDEAKAIALEVAAGRVVEIDQDSEATGLRYDVTILHDDRTSTDVEVDATSGEVTGIKHDDDVD